MESGQTIGAWVLERKLGEGAMGEVWRAHRAEQPAVTAALKRIKGDIDGESAQRFLREAAILADLDHPGVPEFRDYSTSPAFLAMEFVEGVSIGEVLRRRGVFAVPDALEITRQLVEAVAYIHGRDIWHRDIKPDNLILTREGWVKLVDFGVARGDGYADLTAAGMVVGTMAYMPPEAFRGRSPKPLAWDLYAVGVVLHRCLTGLNGFETSLTGVRAQAEQAQLKLVLPCLDPGDDFTEDVRALVRDLTRQRPEHRVSSPGAIGRRVQGLLQTHRGADLARVTAELDPESSSTEGGRGVVGLLVAGSFLGVVVLVGTLLIVAVLAVIVLLFALRLMAA